MPKPTTAPVYWRNGRAYLDARAYADVGGTRESLIAPAEKLATKDPLIARELAARRIRDLEERRRLKLLQGIPRTTTLGAFAQYHLEQKARSNTITDAWMGTVEMHLRHALAFLGDCDLSAITVSRVQAYSTWLSRITRKGKLLSGGTRRQYLNSLSNLFRRAAAEEYVPPGYNPVAALMEKPQAKRVEAHWLEIHEAALLLAATLRVTPERSDGIGPQVLHAILATYLLTGGRSSEVLGLEISDIDLQRSTVTFRENRWRRLKTENARRVVPLWPQLEEILRGFLVARRNHSGRLLFPSPRVDDEAKITDIRKAIDGAATLAGWEAGEIRTKALRHTYCSARLQTLDYGAPVAEITVANEMGHGGFQLVRRIYGHLGRVRHRSEDVEYRVDQHREVLGHRLVTLEKHRAHASAEQSGSIISIKPC